eukprot:TRINITY_DN6570_c0_g2_i1.p2 TRINITY_DN6570_c0_g2~~TRINITY_DN6570_c0_g2_i1.p2  ORF type:complete len:212 (+),score=31.38 TRINITY_DN6570_c0_g2_i1:1563-2198(+)
MAQMYTVPYAAGQRLGFTCDMADNNTVEIVKIEPDGRFAACGVPMGTILAVQGQPIANSAALMDIVHGWLASAPKTEQSLQLTVVPMAADRKAFITKQESSRDSSAVLHRVRHVPGQRLGFTCDMINGEVVIVNIEPDGQFAATGVPMGVISAAQGQVITDTEQLMALVQEWMSTAAQTQRLFEVSVTAMSSERKAQIMQQEATYVREPPS